MPTSTVALESRRFGHDLARLYDEAIARGLNPLAEQVPHFAAVLHQTTNSNREQALRYWTSARTQAPRIEWLRELAWLLLENVSARMVGTGGPPKKWP